MVIGATTSVVLMGVICVGTKVNGYIDRKGGGMVVCSLEGSSVGLGCEIDSLAGELSVNVISVVLLSMGLTVLICGGTLGCTSFCREGTGVTVSVGGNRVEYSDGLNLVEGRPPLVAVISCTTSVVLMGVIGGVAVGSISVCPGRRDILVAVGGNDVG